MEREFEFDPHPDYVEGFNEAYILMQQYPDLADHLAKAMRQSERGDGFLDGREQYIAEKAERMPKWLQNRDVEGKDIDPDKGKDTYEPDR
ncbi:MAG: hypothetical protein R2800_09475 [Flavipsychrobacter sp.]